MRKIFTQILLIILIALIFLYSLAFTCLPIILLFINIGIWWVGLSIPFVFIVASVILLTIASNREEELI